MTAEKSTYTESEMLRMMHAAKLRPSVHRLAVLGYVAGKTHPTADEVYKAMLADFPTVSKTTVYNSLHSLAEAGLLRELEIESESSRYDLARQAPHSHFICRRCGRVFDMGMTDSLESLVTPGFVIDSTELHFKGLCPECSAMS